MTIERGSESFQGPQVGTQIRLVEEPGEASQQGGRDMQ